jgi:hypothetical protein
MNVSVTSQVNLVTRITNDTGSLQIRISQGPPGLDGKDGKDGQPGPPNSLSIGSVVSGDADEPASASISGTSPTQVLNLIIPRGASGIPNGNAITGGTY